MYYCPTEAFTVARDPVWGDTPIICRSVVPPMPVTQRHNDYVPVPPSRLTESELWMLRLGSPGENQLNLMSGKVTGIPVGFKYHPFWHIDWKEEACIKKQNTCKSAERTMEVGRQFYMDFGFMCVSSQDYDGTRHSGPRVVTSWDGFSSYLLIVDEASQYIWVFLTTSKEPPVDIINMFLTRFGHKDGGSVQTDQGGELARSTTLPDNLLCQHNYVIEPTGANSPSQNGAVEIYNGKLAVRTRSLLFGSGLPAKYWSLVLLHLVYLHNRLVHMVTKKTPFEAYFGIKPDLSLLKVFGSCVCVKCFGSRQSKLDKHDFKGIFLGYTATDQNIVYLDLDSGVVKCSHHAKFNEAWYLQPSRPPVAQLLYDLGITEEDTTEAVTDMEQDVQSMVVPWPPMAPIVKSKDSWALPPRSLQLHLPLRVFSEAPPRPFPARAARAHSWKQSNIAAELVDTFKIGKEDLSVLHMSPTLYYNAFEQTIDLRKVDLKQHPTAGLELFEKDKRVHLARISKSTPAAKILEWRSQIQGAWLIQINGQVVTTIADVSEVFKHLVLSECALVTMLFAHPKIRPSLSQDGVPIILCPPFS